MNQRPVGRAVCKTGGTQVFDLGGLGATLPANQTASPWPPLAPAGGGGGGVARPGDRHPAGAALARRRAAGTERGETSATGGGAGAGAGKTMLSFSGSLKVFVAVEACDMRFVHTDFGRPASGGWKIFDLRPDEIPTIKSRVSVAPSTTIP